MEGSKPLGKLAAYGVCAPEGHGFTYSATEHCLLLGLVSVRADLNYQQGLERMWSRQTRLDYYWQLFLILVSRLFLIKKFMLKELLLMRMFWISRALCRVSL